MMKLYFFACLFALTCVGCGTIVGNPGGKKPVEAKSDARRSRWITVNEGTIVEPTVSEDVESPGDGEDNSGGAMPDELRFNLATLKACVVEQTTTVSSETLTVQFSVGTSITATDVKFFHITDEDHFVASDSLTPTRKETEYVYALSYSLRKGCYFTVATTQQELDSKPTKNYVLQSFPTE